MKRKEEGGRRGAMGRERQEEERGVEESFSDRSSFVWMLLRKHLLVSELIFL